MKFHLNNLLEKKSFILYQKKKRRNNHFSYIINNYASLHDDFTNRN